MFDTKAGAIMSAKRLKRVYGVPQARGRELVARAAGYRDWHHLETTIGTPSAPRRDIVAGPWPAAMSDYALRHSLLQEADPSAVLATIAPSAVDSSASNETHRKGKDNDVTVTITETAAAVLDALHAGCTITTQDKEKPTANRIIEPYVVALTRDWNDDESKLRRIDQIHGRYEIGLWTVDTASRRRLDVWKGAEDDDVEVSLRDITILVRGDLVTRDTGGNLDITDAGRAIAQARIGDGVNIVDHVAVPVSVVPSDAYRIGQPSFFKEMQEAEGESALVLYSRQGKPAFKASGYGHTAYSWVEPAVARTIAGMMADVGKVDRDTSAAFGPVRVTLHSDGDVTFAFGDWEATAAARISKIQAKAVKAYLGELAKGAGTTATIDPADVRMGLRYIVMPGALGSWDDVDIDEDEDEREYV